MLARAALAVGGAGALLLSASVAALGVSLAIYLVFYLPTDPFFSASSLQTVSVLFVSSVLAFVASVVMTYVAGNLVAGRFSKMASRVFVVLTSLALLFLSLIPLQSESSVGYGLALASAAILAVLAAVFPDTSVPGRVTGRIIGLVAVVLLIAVGFSFPLGLALGVVAGLIAISTVFAIVISVVVAFVEKMPRASSALHAVLAISPLLFGIALTYGGFDFAFQEIRSLTPPTYVIAGATTPPLVFSWIVGISLLVIGVSGILILSGSAVGMTYFAMVAASNTPESSLEAAASGTAGHERQPAPLQSFAPTTPTKGPLKDDTSIEFCPKCGTRLIGDEEFCRRCGRRLLT